MSPIKGDIEYIFSCADLKSLTIHYGILIKGLNDEK